jgi:hypothetical protein
MGGDVKTLIKNIDHRIEHRYGKALPTFLIADSLWGISYIPLQDCLQPKIRAVIQTIESKNFAPNAISLANSDDARHMV